MKSSAARLESVVRCNEKIETAESLVSLMGWDQMVMMPASGAEWRARQSSYLDTHVHELRLDQSYFENLEALDREKAELSATDRAAVKHLLRDVR
jgi:Zn-dependent M32 family carboxypeptidase